MNRADLQNGFSLISILVYVSIHALLVGLLFHLAAHVIDGTYKIKRSYTISCASLYSLLSRELARAPCHPSCWVQPEPSALFWKDADLGYTGFMKKDTKLVRVHGSYNAQLQTIQGISTVVFQGVSEVTFFITSEHNSVKQVHCRIVSGKRVREYAFLLQNRQTYDYA